MAGPVGRKLLRENLPLREARETAQHAASSLRPAHEDRQGAEPQRDLAVCCQTPHRGSRRIQADRQPQRGQRIKRMVQHDRGRHREAVVGGAGTRPALPIEALLVDGRRSGAGIQPDPARRIVAVRCGRPRPTIDGFLMMM